MAPIVYLSHFNRHASQATKGISAEELADIDRSKEAIEQYQKIYDIFDYCTRLNSLMYALEIRVSANNPSIPPSIYRQSSSTNLQALFPEIEACLTAYYGLIDDCENCPEWREKVEKELGSTVSYLFLTLDESSRDALVQESPVWARFDAEKQIFFK